MVLGKTLESPLDCKEIQGVHSKGDQFGIETCIISHMKRVASPGSMHNTGCLGLVHWDDPELMLLKCGIGEDS